MDLKSLKERKAMLSESYEVENLLSKPPLKFDVNNLSGQPYSKLDKLGDICKVLKPNNVELPTLSAINASFVDMEHRQFTKTCQLKNILSEVENFKAKMSSIINLQNEVTTLEGKVRLEKNAEDELQLKGHSRENIELEKLAGAQKAINEKYDTSGVEAELHSRLLTESDYFRKLQSENKSLSYRLRKVPVEPGFEFTTSHLQKLLNERQEQLEELKNQVLTASIME